MILPNVLDCLDGSAMLTRTGINHGEYTYLNNTANKAQGGQGVGIVCAWSHPILFSLNIQEKKFLYVSGLFSAHF